MIKKMTLALLVLTGIGANAQDNVGIGTTNPQNKLHVAGDVRIETIDAGADADKILVADADGVVKDAGITKAELAAAVSGAEKEPWRNTDGTAATDASIDINYMNGMVGIGKVPEELFEVYDSSNKTTLSFRHGTLSSDPAVNLPRFSLSVEDHDRPYPGIDVAVSNDAGYPSFGLYKSKGTKANPAIQDPNKVVGQIYGNSYIGDDKWATIGRIRFRTSTTHATGDTGGIMDFEVHPQGIAVGYTNAVRRMRITEYGNLIVGAPTSEFTYTDAAGATQKAKLSVDGAIVTNTSVYADYVFEDYLDGSSTIKEDYKFKTLAEVDSFIKANKHLPGVTSIKDLQKTANGYAVNISALSVQVLEKTEELYLHTIDQQKTIDALVKENARTAKENEALKARLAKIEKALGL